MALYLGMQSSVLKYIFRGAALLLLFCSGSMKAQSVVVTDSINTAFLPALSYSSDYGLVGGGLVQRYHYKPRQGEEPFYSFLTVAGVISTKGLASALVELDKPNLFGSDIRMFTELYSSRFFEDPYFGIGAYQKILNSIRTDDELYYFKSFSVGFELSLRKPLVSTLSGKTLDLTGILNFDYETPWDNSGANLIAIEQPLGFKGGKNLFLGAGLIYEARDNEFRPASGRYASLTARAGQNWFGSDYDAVVVDGELRNYYTFFLLRDITLANRLIFRHTSGEVPYWKLAYAGDEETIRGYPAKRFRDDNSVVLNTELRTWLFRINAINGEFGGTLFVDVGRTFPNGESLQTITEDLKYSFGFGGLSSFFTSDFILRTDVGFSDEGIGIYFSAGYMF